MSQDASQPKVIGKFSFIYTLTHSRSVKKNIHQLEKKLSVDINEVTDRGNKKQHNEIIDSSSSLDSVSLSSILGFPNLAANNGSALDLLKPSTADYALDWDEELELSVAEEKSSPFIIHHLSKILFALSCGYLVLVFWWLSGHNYYGQIFPFSGVRALFYGSGEQVSPADLKFIDYMERSLAAIEGEQEIEPEQEDSEVVYIPIYNLTNPNTTNPNIPASIYNLPSLFGTNNPPLPVIPPPPPQDITTPTFSTSSSAEVPPSSFSSAEEAKITSNSANSTTRDYTLIGIFELEERSAALFEVDGVTKRIWVGEKVDSTGWILDSVMNQQATIRRQGQVLSLSVGEKL